MSRSLIFYLKALSVAYLIGALLHFMDILDLRLKFSEMNDLWKAWVLFLLVADIIAAIGLWKNTAWGVWTFLIVASSQIVAYTFFQDHFSKQTFLVGFHILTIGLYLVIKVRSTPSNPQL